MVALLSFTDRVTPVVEIGVGNTFNPVGDAQWSTPGLGGVGGISRWGTARWSSLQPIWHDVACDTISADWTEGTNRSLDHFVVGTATVVLDNSTGWASPDPAGQVQTAATLLVRPGASLRIGVRFPEQYGEVVQWKYRGVIDEAVPDWTAGETPTVTVQCIDALGDVARAKLPQLPAPVGAGETVSARINRILNLIGHPAPLRSIETSPVLLLESDMSGQAVDLLRQAADSAGGAIFGDHQGRIVYRSRDWQTWPTNAQDDPDTLWIGDGVSPGVPPPAVQACPVQWRRPFARKDITTRVILNTEGSTSPERVYDDDDAISRYGIEPFERTNLLTVSTVDLDGLGERYLLTRGAGNGPRVEGVTLNAEANADSIDVMVALDVFKPSRVLATLTTLPGGFGVTQMVTGVDHHMTRDEWTVDVTLDNDEPYIAEPGRWEGGSRPLRSRWGRSLWNAA